MSLINDALKRAGATPPPPPDMTQNVTPLQPVAERKQQAVWPVIILPLGLVGLFLMAGFFLLRGFHARRLSAVTDQASIVTAREQSQPTQPSPTTSSREKQPQETPAPGNPVTKAVTQAAATEANTPVAPTNAAAAAEPATPAATTTPPPPEWPPLKLQGVVYGSSNPSAVINNKALFVGESIGPVKVVAITQTNVTIELSGQRRELTLR